MSQWLVVQGVRYDLEEAMKKPSIRSLVDLQKAAGLSLNTIEKTWNGLSSMESPAELFESAERLSVFAAAVFLCRRKAGDQVSFEEAADISMSDIRLEFDDDEDAEADDPKDQSTPEAPESGTAD